MANQYDIPSYLSGNLENDNMPIFSDGLSSNFHLVPVKEADVINGTTPLSPNEGSRTDESDMTIFADGPEYQVANNDGSVTNVVTGETRQGGTAGIKDSNELAEVAATGDHDEIDEFTNQFLTKIGAKKSAYEYDIKEQKDGYMPALSQFAITALGAYLAKERGASDRQVGIMLSHSLAQGGKQIKEVQDQIGRQKHIDALEVEGYRYEDINQWLKTGKTEDLTAQAKARGALAAQSRQNKTGYYDKGDTLPDGSKASKAGNYTTTFTNTLGGIPQVAMIHYDGDEAGLKHDQAIERIKLQDQLATQRAQDNQWTMHSHDGRTYRYNKSTGEMIMEDESTDVNTKGDRSDWLVHQHETQDSYNAGATQAMSSMNKADAYLKQFENKKDDMRSGWGGAAETAIRNVIGTQDDVEMFRKEIQDFIVSGALSKLPPGAASDVDVNLAMSTMPDPYTNPEAFMTYLENFRNAQRAVYDFNNFAATAYQRNGGSTVNSEGQTIAQEYMTTKQSEEPESADLDDEALLNKY